GLIRRGRRREKGAAVVSLPLGSVLDDLRQVTECVIAARSVNPPGSGRAALASDVVTVLDDSACLASHRVVVAPGLLRTCAIQLNRLVKQLAEGVVRERGTARGAHRSDATVQRDEPAKAATEEVAGYGGLYRLRLASQVVIAHLHRARERVATDGAGSGPRGPRRVNSRGWRPHALVIACDRGLLAERVVDKRS